MNILRFACGAESPPFEGSFGDWVRVQIRDLKGYALGRRRHDGRYRVIAYDLDGQSLSPRMPDGRRSPCLTCPCPKEAGRREIEAKRVDLRGIRRIVVTCYPEEVSVDALVEAAIDDATRKVASATPPVAPATSRVAELHSCFRHGDYPGDVMECPECSEERTKRERERSEK